MPSQLSTLHSRKAHRGVAVAALAVELTPGGVPAELRLIPAGPFRSVDIRPAECAAWELKPSGAQRIVAAAAARASDYVIDYDHQTLRAAENGKPAPASGWFKALEWRTDGLYITDVRWTSQAAEMIASGAYRYISPVFSYDEKTGEILALSNVSPAALVNSPGIDGLTDLAALAALAFTSDQPPQEPPMDEILEQLRWMLNLPLSATPEEISAELVKLKARIDGAKAANLAALLDVQAASVAALTAQSANPDPAKFVALSVADGLRAQIASLSAEVAASRQEKTAALVAGALSDGRITPAEEGWARSYAEKDVDGFQAMLAARTPIVSLGASQTGGAAPSGSGTGAAALSATDLAVCQQFGLSEADYRKTLADQAQA